MMLSNWLSCAALAILAAPVYAQSGGFEMPAAGLVYSHGSRAVRPLLGIPGSTHIGAAVLNDVNQAWVAPGGKWAFVTMVDRSVFVRGLLEAAPAEIPVAGVIDGVDHVAWSRDAAFAVLYSSSAARLQRVRLVNGEITAGEPVDLTPWGAPAALAIDPSGRQVAFGIAGAGIYIMDGDQSPALLVSLARATAVAFSDAGRLYAVDAESRRIVEFAADFSPSDFASVEVAEGVEFEPVGLAVSGSGKYLMVADRGTRTLRVWETAARTAAGDIRLDFAPAAIERLSTGATFLLNRPRGTEWLLVLDATDMPRIYFVPGGEERAQ